MHRVLMLTVFCAVMLGRNASADPYVGEVTFFAGEATDPIGDLFPVSIPQQPDLILARIEIGHAFVEFSTLFAPGTFDALTSTVSFDLDTDQNPATGVPWRGMLGLDYEVSQSIGSDNTSAGIVKFGTGSVGSVPVTFSANGVAFTVPRSLLGDAGLMKWDVVVQTRLGADVFSTIQDWAPNGLPPATTEPVPEPTTLVLETTGFAFLFARYSRLRWAARFACRLPEAEPYDLTRNDYG